MELGVCGRLMAVVSSEDMRGALKGAQANRTSPLPAYRMCQGATAPVSPLFSNYTAPGALAAGGRVTYDRYAPSWWTLTDPEGNEADIATWEGRG